MAAPVCPFPVPDKSPTSQVLSLCWKWYLARPGQSATLTRHKCAGWWVQPANPLADPLASFFLQDLRSTYCPELPDPR